MILPAFVYHHHPNLSQSQKNTKIGVCTDVKLISNTTVERSRDKLLFRLYSNIQPFLFTQSTRSPHPPTESPGFSPTICTPVLEFQILSGISQKHLILSFPFFFFYHHLQATEKRNSRNTRFHDPLESEKGSGSSFIRVKDKDIKFPPRKPPMSRVTRE